MEENKHHLQTKIHNQSELVDYFAEAIRIREQHPDQSEAIARQVFDNTHPALLSFEVSQQIQIIRNEFGALEAPGLPDDDTDPDVYRDHLWQRVKKIVNKKGTV